MTMPQSSSNLNRIGVRSGRESSHSETKRKNSHSRRIKSAFSARSHSQTAALSVSFACLAAVSFSLVIRTLDFDLFTRRSHNMKRDFYMESVDEMMPRLMLLLRLLHRLHLRFPLHLRHSRQQKGRETATDIGMWQRHFTPFALRLSSAAAAVATSLLDTTTSMSEKRRKFWKGRVRESASRGSENGTAY